MPVQLLSLTLIPIIISIFFFIVDKENDKKILLNSKKDYIVIKAPKAFPIVFVIAIPILAYFTILAYQQEETFSILFFGLLVLFCIVFLLYFLIWKIDFYKNKDYFIYHTIFRKAQKIYYSDCEKFTWNRQGDSFKIKTKSGKSFYVSMYANNYEDLRVKMLQSKVKEILKSKKRK